MAVARRVRSHPRSAAAVLAIAVLAAAFTLVLSGSSGRATSSGSPYVVPLATDTNADPTTFETTITAQTATVDINAPATTSVHAETYNGSIPGPTLMLNVGDTVIVHFVNHLSEPTAIHWHGIELPNAMDGTPLTQNMVQPNGTFLYKFKVPRPGIYWYHPHHHSSTNQVFKGLYGMIVVKDPDEDTLIANGTLPPAANTKQIVLSDTTVCKTAGSNDLHTYDDTDDATAGVHLPWVGTGNLPHQPPPLPRDICQGSGSGGSAVDADGTAMVGNYALGDIPSIQATADGRENEGQTVLTNGKNVGGRTATQGDPNIADPPNDSKLSALGAPTGNPSLLDVQPGQGLRLQILNAATFRYMRLRLTRSNGALVGLVRVGGEGGLLNTAQTEGGNIGAFNSQYTQGEILVPPGSRADVVAAIPPDATGVMTLWTEDFQRLGPAGSPGAPNTGFTVTPTVPVMHLNVTGAALGTPYTIVGGLTPTTGTPLRDATGHPQELLPGGGTFLSADGFSPAKRGKKSPVLPISLDGGGGATINGIKGDHDVANYAVAPHMGGVPPADGSTRYARLGDNLTLSTLNNTGAHHPFHLHGFSIQPVTLVNGGTTYTFPREFRDNVDIPPGYTLNYKVRLDDRAQPDGTTAGGGLGRWVFHCHIFFHATLGMLSEVVVLPAGLPATNGDERPNVNTNVTSVTVNQGATATFTGTFNDQDAGDAVTLTPSVGTVTDTGGGTYSWSFPTGTAPSQFVYITGTDAAGAKVQMPVQLTINNTPPSLTVPAAQTVRQGDTLSFDVSADDTDTVDPLALTASGLPATMTFKDNGNRTGTASGQVTDPPGTYTPTISVNDGKNAAVSGNVQITVTAPLLTPLVSAKEKLVKKRITVGCKFALASIAQCAAAVTRAAKQVGNASASSAPGKASLNVAVPLSKATRRAVARSVGGVPVDVALTATRPDASAPFAATKKTKVIPPRIKVVTGFAAFKGATSTLTNRAQRWLTALAKKVGSAKHIVCTGHPDRGSNSKARATARAAAGCAALQAAGLKATFDSVGSKAKHNRHLEITILR